MADQGGATATGLKELSAAVERLPVDVTAALKSVAQISAHRVKAHAQQLLRTQTHGTGATANAITVIPEPENKQYVVDSLAPPGKPANLPLWLERGTRFMAARPYMRPAGDAEDEHYKAESLRAVEGIANQLEKL